MAALWAVCGVAQRTVTLAKKDIPHAPVDTLPTDRPEFRIVTFADNTFKYIPADPDAFFATEVYQSHWDTVKLFVYRDIELSDIAETVQIQLVAGEGEYRCPASGRILSKYGRRGRRNHNGTDIKVEQGEPIYAAFDGVVRLSHWNSGGYGNLVIIRHPNGLETYYGHLSRRNVIAGDVIKAGQVIGYGGRTGRASGTHLHFETRYCDQTFDPEHIFNIKKGQLRHNEFTLKKSYFSINSRAVEGLGEDSDTVATTDSTSLSVADSTAIAPTPEPPPPPAKEYHKIRKGDTLTAIARRYGTTVSELCRLNGISRNGVLRIGSSLRVR